MDDATPRLTGVSGILYAIEVGAQVRILVTRNDTTSQTAVAAALGVGDGIIADTIDDDSLDVDGAAFVGDAKLALLANPVTTVRMKTRSKFARSGWVVNISTTQPPISGDFIIQQVTIEGLEGDTAVWPVRSCTLAPYRRNLYDLLKNITAPFKG